MLNTSKSAVFTAKSYGRETSVTLDHCDFSMSDFIDVMKVLAVGLSFSEEQFEEAIIEAADEYHFNKTSDK
jgi:hypothetical protein